MPTQVNITIEEFKNLLSQYDLTAHLASKQARRERPWVRDLIAVLVPRPDGINMDELTDTLWKMREKTLPMPKEFRKTVQSRLNHYTRQSNVYRKNGARPEDDLFYSPRGKGSGTWAANTDRAIAWLKRKGLPPT